MSNKRSKHTLNVQWPFELAFPRQVFGLIYKKKWLLMLTLVVWSNAIIVALTTHQVRQQTVLLEQLKNEQHDLEMEWEALRLEQGTLAEHNRIESLAKQKLKMKNVAAKDEQLVEIK